MCMPARLRPRLLALRESLQRPGARALARAGQHTGEQRPMNPRALPAGPRIGRMRKPGR